MHSLDWGGKFVVLPRVRFPRDLAVRDWVVLRTDHKEQLVHESVSFCGGTRDALAEYARHVPTPMVPDWLPRPFPWHSEVLRYGAYGPQSLIFFWLPPPADRPLNIFVCTPRMCSNELFALHAAKTPHCVTVTSTTGTHLRRTGTHQYRSAPEAVSATHLAARMFLANYGTLTALRIGTSSKPH